EKERRPRSEEKDVRIKLEPPDDYPDYSNTNYEENYEESNVKYEQGEENYNEADYFEVIIEPNRNAEAYRNYVPPDLPALVENYIDFIEFCADGYMLLGSSNLTGRHWCGSLWYFIDPDGAPDVEKCLTGMTCENGVCDGKFLSDRQ
ncbi:unnamed protein product, partial [Timema podura]|nr:unnamed protein product [Timema podura]